MLVEDGLPALPALFEHAASLLLLIDTGIERI
jgi:hypothetical protein